MLKGKFGYMSPEQVRGLPLDRRSDMFAIGTMLYELLTRERLFLGESDFATLEKVRNVDMPPPRRVNPTCPPELEQHHPQGARARTSTIATSGRARCWRTLQAFLMTREPVFTAK